MNDTNTRLFQLIRQMSKAIAEMEALPMVDGPHEGRCDWRRAVDDMLVVCHMTASDSPRESLNRLIHWHCVIALDPAVSSDAMKLVEKERKLLRRALTGLVYHREQTRPIHSNDVLIAELRELLESELLAIS